MAECMIGLYQVNSRARRYGMGCPLCRGIVEGPADDHHGFDPRLRWQQHRCDDGTWTYEPLCPTCATGLDLVGAECS